MPLLTWLPGKTVKVQAVKPGSGSSWMSGWRRRGIANTPPSRIAWASGPTGRPYPSSIQTHLSPHSLYPKPIRRPFLEAAALFNTNLTIQGGSPFQDQPYNTKWQPFSIQTLEYNVAALFRTNLTIQSGSPFQGKPYKTMWQPFSRPTLTYKVVAFFNTNLTLQCGSPFQDQPWNTM